jgi:hypothetical protein
VTDDCHGHDRRDALHIAVLLESQLANPVAFEHRPGCDGSSPRMPCDCPFPTGTAHVVRQREVDAATIERILGHAVTFGRFLADGSVHPDLDGDLRALVNEAGGARD